MELKMLVNTIYKGPRKVGEIVEVPEVIAKRWIKNGIAVIVKTGEEVEEFKKEVEEVINEEDKYDLESMTAKELYELCIDQGLDVEQKKAKKYYLDALAKL